MTGLNPGQTSTLTVYVSRSGYTNESASKVGTAKIGVGLTTRFSTLSVKQATNSFTVKISNYNSAFGYQIESNYGALTVGNVSNGVVLLTVTGLNSRTLRNTTIKVTTSRTGYASVTSSITS